MVKTPKTGNLIDRPSFGSLPVAAALDHDWRGFDVSEKMDGVWHELAIGQSVNRRVVARCLARITI